MTHFNRLLLASLIAASSSAFAMESLEDEVLSDTTGQTGVTIGITPPNLSFSVVIHDTDGIPVTQPNSGAIVMGDPYTTPLARTKTQLAFTGEVVVLIDATGDHNGAVAGGTPMLRANVAIPGMTLHTGDIYVADTDATGTLAGFDGLRATATANILSDITVTMGATTLNFELGSENQGSMIKINTSMATGLSIAGIALSDAGGAQTGGAFRTDMTIKDNNAAALTVVADVDFIATGMRVNLTQFGHATNGADIRLSNLKFGDGAAPVIGNVDIVGLNMNNTAIRIAGH